MLRKLRQSRVAPLFTRFAVGTVVATACSQLTFVLLFGVLGTTTSVSGGVAFLAGAVPNFLIHRFWTWRRRGPVTVRHELLPYLAVIAFNGLVATGITTGMDRFLGGAIDDHVARTAVLTIIFTLSYLPLFVLKFALLDRLVFSGPEFNGPEFNGTESSGAGFSRADRRARARRAHDSRAQVPTSTLA